MALRRFEPATEDLIAAIDEGVRRTSAGLPCEAASVEPVVFEDPAHPLYRHQSQRELPQ